MLITGMKTAPAISPLQSLLCGSANLGYTVEVYECAPLTVVCDTRARYNGRAGMRPPAVIPFCLAADKRGNIITPPPLASDPSRVAEDRRQISPTGHLAFAL